MTPNPSKTTADRIDKDNILATGSSQRQRRPVVKYESKSLNKTLKKKSKKNKQELKKDAKRKHKSKSRLIKTSRSKSSLRPTKSLTDAAAVAGPSRGRPRRRSSARIASCSPHPSGYSALSARNPSADSGVKKARRRRKSHGWSNRKRSRSRSAARPPKTTAAGPSQLHTRDDEADKPKPVQPVTTDTGVDFSDVGGLHEQIEKLKEMIVFPFRYPEVFKKFGCPRGVLFYGPPGTGKTLVARALVHELSKGTQKVTFYSRSGSDILSKWFGESESNLRDLFEAAKTNQPSVIFFDELDALAPARNSQQDHVYTTIVGALLTLLDGLEDRQQVVVIGATNRPDALDSALRRPGRFDREIFFPPPNLEARREILRISAPDGCSELLTWLSERTSGFCGADIALLIREAFLAAVKEAYPSIYNTAVKVDIDPTVKVMKRHYETALASFRPSGGRGMQEWREVVPEILHPLIDHDRQHLVDVISRRCPWLLPNKVKRGEICSQMRVLMCPDERYPEDPEYVSKSVLSAFADCNIWTMDDAYVMSLTCVDVMQLLSERIHDVGRHRSPTVLYMPRLEELEEALQLRVGTGLERLLGMLPRWAPLLVVLTSVQPYPALVEQQRAALATAHLHKVVRPGQPQRTAFFTTLLSHGRHLSERSIDQLVELTRGWSVQELGQLSVRVSQIRAETKHTPSVASLIKELTIERQLNSRRA
ncbi:ATPase family AAA domain-containing protein 2-like [Amphibalanus amphitrite]|uniref:ATPase family AAA domain-containing protein 2-like n=1 Tax=Amphibalanus amphitrite TaxID=1232801 RepID=UPI001C915D0B|nr:ATPase family AAA domain-containing protein 2-like [Amphibalanus amphitrite]